MLTELCISVCYLSAGLLVYLSSDHEMIMWSMIVSIFLTYLLHATLGIYRAIRTLAPILKSWIKLEEKATTVHTVPPQMIKNVNLS